MNTIKWIGCCLLGILPICLFGQNSIQYIDLQPGWNAIYLEVDPSVKACSEIFKDLPIKSVRSLKQTSSLFLATDKSDWHIYEPYNPDKQDFFGLTGGKSYLVQLEGETSKTIKLIGTPVLPKLQWKKNQLQLTGFHIEKGEAPSFKTYLGKALQIGNKDVYKMTSDGEWRIVKNLDKAVIQKGTAYLVRSKKEANYTGPVTIRPAQSNGLHFGKVLMQQTIKISNRSNVDQQVNLHLIRNAATRSNNRQSAGEVALTIWDKSAAKFISFGSDWTTTLAAGESTSVQIGVDRTRMKNGGKRTYHSILAVTDNTGTEIQVPISAKGLAERTGLWVGYATINKVNYVNVTDDSPRPTASEFTIRLIMHVDEEGNSRLLNEVTQMWQDGTMIADPEDPAGTLVTDEPGQYVLITQENLLANYKGSAVRDGKAVGRRLSSPFFSFEEPQILAGDFEDELQLRNLRLDYNDPINPFKHQFHPDHNNLDERYENSLPEGVESYTILRDLDFEFTAQNPEALIAQNWGDNEVGGIYKEAIKGIHRQTLKVEGFFRLRKVSNIGVLNSVPAIQNLTDTEEEGSTEIDFALITKPQKSTTLGDLSLHPNPVTNQVQIRGLAIDQTYQVRLIDNMGRELAMYTYSDNGTINTSNLFPGVYHLQIWQNGEVNNLRFVKQHP